MKNMFFESILITGTDDDKNIAVVKELCHQNDKRFYEVQLCANLKVTNNSYTAWNTVQDNVFDELINNNSLVYYVETSEGRFGINTESVNKAYIKDRIVVFSVPAFLFTSIIEANDDFYNENNILSIFINTQDEVLIEKEQERLSVPLDNKYKNRIHLGNSQKRKDMYKAHYTLNTGDETQIASLINMFCDFKNRGGGLYKKLICNMISCGILLRNADINMVKGASYDLRLGDEYYYNGSIRSLTNEKPILTIEPYDYAIVSCKETACIPRDVIGKFGLTVSLFCQGVVFSNGPQIDPGFRGTLFCLLFNTSNQPIYLKRGQHYATIEFNKLLDFAPPYEGHYQDEEKIINYLPSNALHGGINELKKEVEALKNESRSMQNIYLSVVAIIFAFISVIIAIK